MHHLESVLFIYSDLLQVLTALCWTLKKTIRNIEIGTLKKRTRLTAAEVVKIIVSLYENDGM